MAILHPVSERDGCRTKKQERALFVDATSSPYHPKLPLPRQPDEEGCLISGDEDSSDAEEIQVILASSGKGRKPNRVTFLKEKKDKYMTLPPVCRTCTICKKDPFSQHHHTIGDYPGLIMNLFIS